jgi:hypothetical protein
MADERSASPERVVLPPEICLNTLADSAKNCGKVALVAPSLREFRDALNRGGEVLAVCGGDCEAARTFQAVPRTGLSVGENSAGGCTFY